MTPEPEAPTPIGFRLLVVAAALYLLVRLVEMVGWVLKKL